MAAKSNTNSEVQSWMKSRKLGLIFGGERETPPLESY
jgi:hypothetical protein